MKFITCVCMCMCMCMCMWGSAPLFALVIHVIKPRRLSRCTFLDYDYYTEYDETTQTHHGICFFDEQCHQHTAKFAREVKRLCLPGVRTTNTIQENTKCAYCT